MNAFTPTVSVIVSVYNGERTIADCVQSLLAQDYPADKYEILIVENGSTDNTTAIVKRYPVTLLHSPMKGLARARNYGIERAIGQIIAMTDADCVADPHWISGLVELYQDPCVGGVGGLIKDYVHSEMSWSERFAAEAQPLVNYVSGECEFLPHLAGANCSYRRELLIAAGLFNPQIPTYYGEDVEMSWRLQIRTGTNLAYAPKAVIHHHHRSTASGLFKQYRHYGFGEIFLDTLFLQQNGYPRTLRFQMGRIGRQASVLPKYLAAAAVRAWHLVWGRITPYDALRPLYRFMIEVNNIIGKLDALLQTSFMRDVDHVLDNTRKYD